MKRLVPAAAAVGGAVLFAYAVRSAGVDEILEGVRRVGWGLIAILALAGARFALRSAAWRLCMPPAATLTFRQSMAAFLAGDAVGSVTPLGLLASEPTKVFLTRHHLATREAVASLALENIVYALSVAATVALGVAVLIVSVPLPGVWRSVAAGVLAGGFIAAAIVIRLMQGTWDPARGPRPRWREQLAGIRAAILGFSASHPSRLWRVFALDVAFHALAVFEVYITLWWLLGASSPTFAQAMVFEALNRVVTVVFKFVPFRIGVDEAFSGALAPLLQVDPATGVTLAVVRKVRNLFWAGVGLVITVRSR